MTCNIDKLSVLKRLQGKNKDFYSPIINGMIESASHQYFQDKGFLMMNVASLNRCHVEKLWNVIVDYHGIKCELSASNALELTALAAIYGNVYSISNTYREESIHSKNHLLEFKMLEAEWKIEEEEELFLFIEGYLMYIVNVYNEYIRTNMLEEIFPKKEISFPIKRINYLDAVTMLKEKGNEVIFDEYGFCDIDISSCIEEPCFIMDYPFKGSWRAKRKNQTCSYLYNLVLPNDYGELIECSVRETRAEYYIKKFSHLGLSEIYEWYTTALKVNENPRCGMGMGLERLCCWLMELDSIEVQKIFPRQQIYFEEGVYNDV